MGDASVMENDSVINDDSTNVYPLITSEGISIVQNRDGRED